MKKVLIILIVLLLVSQPVIAFSIRDILNDFRDIFTGFIRGEFITGRATKTCSDGTLYGECSTNKPLYCNWGVLEDNCGLCGCNIGYTCNTATNKCESIQQQCSDGTPYNQCSSTKPLYCSNGNLIDDCILCGCDVNYECNVITNKCELIQQQCSDGTNYGSCSTNKPLYCNNGVLENNCGLCGCDVGYECDITTNTCIPGLPSPSDCGTIPQGSCTGNGKYCDNGVLMDKCSVCNCNTGYQCDFVTNKCIETAPSYSNCGNVPHDSCDNNNYCYDGSLEFNCNKCGCEVGDICQNNACIKESKCITDGECEEGYICLNRVCTKEEQDGEKIECRIDADCGGGYKCKNNACEEFVIDPGGNETNSTEVLNRIPIVFAIGDQIIEVGESFEVEINAADPDEDDELDYYFMNYLKKLSNNIISCSLSENILRCSGVGAGEGTLKIVVFDGLNEVLTNVVIKVLGGITGNNPPVADAGSDKLGIPEKEIILDGSRSYDKDGHSLTYQWYEGNNLIGENKIVKKKFSKGSYEIKLLVTDPRELSDEDIINVKIRDKKTCKDTGAVYVPQDTICNNKWPNGDGKELQINSPEDSCESFEVCSDELDYLIEESIECCTTDNLIRDPRKAAACNFAREFSQNAKDCGANYLIKIFGGLAAGPMRDYFNAEMCCKGVRSLCPNKEFLYKAEPLPDYLEGVKCSNTPLNSPYGEWISNIDLTKNEIALADLPASVSIEIIKSGTCTDYSMVLTTLLRKGGYGEREVYTAESYDHVYNLVKFENDAKYHIFDTTGNYEGYVPGNVPSGYNYCEELLRCYNDNGEALCPKNKIIIGCENVKEKTGRSSVKIIAGIKKIFKMFEEEITR